MSIRSLLLKFAIASIAFLLLATIYLSFAAKQFRTSATIIVQRPRVENPVVNSEEIKNRWVWLRDGYAAKEDALSDSFFAEARRPDSELHTLWEEFRKDKLAAGASEDDLVSLFAEAHKRVALEVDFTGGDVNTFVVTARHSNPQYALQLVKAALARIRSFYVHSARDEYHRTLQSIQNKIASLRQHHPRPTGHTASVNTDVLQRTYDQIVVAQTIFEANAAHLTRVISEPVLPRSSSWPKGSVLFIFAEFLALGVALVWQLIRNLKY